MHHKLYIIIVTWNGEQYIYDCLNSVYNQSEADFGVIVVDNGSNDRTREIIKEQFKDVILIENGTNLGFAGGNNIGIRKALSLGAEYVALLNQDTEVPNIFVSNCVAYLQANSNIGLASPIVLYPKDNRIWFAGSRIFRGREILTHPTTKIGEHINKKMLLDGKTDKYTADWLSGCALFIKKEVFSKIGFIDEKFFMYGEDVDFSLRAVRAGYDLGIVSNTKIIHKEELNKKLIINSRLVKKAIYMIKARWTIVYRYYGFKEKCYYIIKLVYTPFFQLIYAVRKIIS
ncbi:MAG: glycosyltransferase family 2 protein [Patescibacteria group bacterium]